MTRLHEVMNLECTDGLIYTSLILSQSKSSIHIYHIFHANPLAPAAGCAAALRVCDGTRDGVPHSRYSRCRFQSRRGLCCSAGRGNVGRTGRGKLSPMQAAAADRAGRGIPLLACQNVCSGMVTCHRIVHSKSEFWSDSQSLKLAFHFLLRLQIPKCYIGSLWFFLPFLSPCACTGWT